MTREEEIKERHDTFDVQYFYPGSGKYFGEADADMQWLLARNEGLQRRVEKMERVVELSKRIYRENEAKEIMQLGIDLSNAITAVDAKEQDDD